MTTTPLKWVLFVIRSGCVHQESILHYVNFHFQIMHSVSRRKLKSSLLMRTNSFILFFVLKSFTPNNVSVVASKVRIIPLYHRIPSSHKCTPKQCLVKGDENAYVKILYPPLSAEDFHILWNSSWRILKMRICSDGSILLILHFSNIGFSLLCEK